MHLHAFDYVVWGFGFAIQVGILLAMYRRGLHRDYPFFANYQLLQVLSEPVLFVVQRHSYAAYYWGYYVSVALSALISAAILYEVAQALFRRGTRLSRRTAAVFITLVSVMAAVVAVVVVMWAITSSQANSIDGLTNAILLAQRTVRLLQCGLALLLIISWKSLHMPRRDPLLGIMAGFALFATVSLLFAVAVSHGTFVAVPILRHINSAAYSVACVIWLVSVLRAPAQTRWAEWRFRPAI